MYEIIENGRRMTFKELSEEYKGKWLYLADLDNKTPFERWNTAIPVVMADDILEGYKSGIYDKIDERYDGNTADISFLTDTWNVFGFVEVPMNED